MNKNNITLVYQQAQKMCCQVYIKTSDQIRKQVNCTTYNTVKFRIYEQVCNQILMRLTTLRYYVWKTNYVWNTMRKKTFR